MSPAAGTRRLHGLDGLRGLAASGILVLHVSMYTDRADPPFSAGDAVLRGLHVGVPLFFVLSGFLLFSPWVDPARRPPALRHYVKRRAARIFPAYWVALAGAALMLLGTGTPLMPRPRDVPLLLTVQQDLFPSVSDLIPPAWTLGVEVTYYAVLPLLGLVTVRLVRGTAGRLLGCGGLMAGSLAVAWAARDLPEVPAKLTGTLVGYFYAFAAGMGAATIAARAAPGRRARRTLLAGGAALVVLDAALHVPLRAPVTAWLADGPAAVGFAALILAVAAGDQRVLGSRPLRLAGERSYALYLWHFPIIVALARRGLLPAHLWAGMLVVAPLAWLAADLSWRLVERPAIGLARRKRSRVEPEVRAPVAAPVGALVPSGPDVEGDGQAGAAQRGGERRDRRPEGVAGPDVEPDRRAGERPRPVAREA